MNKPVSILLCALCFLLVCCRKDSFITSTNATITVSADSVQFDTLFTTTGSLTQAFKIYNDNDQKLRLNTIELGGGAASFFRINADGFEGPSVSNLELAANDSIYVFVTVSIDQNTDNLPFVVQDSILISFNGKQRTVQLQAWGQNAHFLRQKVITTNTTWTNDKPYVILGGLQVTANTVLTIEKGTKVYLHADAPLLIDGTLLVNGNRTDSMDVIFSGDRLDEPYKGFPGSWPGIYFRETSKDNLLEHAIIKNAYQGIVVQEPSVNSAPKLVLDKCIVDNCYDAGIIGLHTDLRMVNSVVSNCGKNMQLYNGGNYELTQCTIVCYSNSLIAHKDPVLVVTNYIKQGDNLTAFDLNAEFTNCIFWGDNGIVDNEVVADHDESAPFDVSFVNCLWKVATAPGNVTVAGMIENQDPMFVLVDTRNNSYDFHPGQNSPVLGAGINVGVTSDLDEKPRDVNFPALGAYEPTF